MKRYRFKIDTPWGKKGDEVPRSIGVTKSFSNIYEDIIIADIPLAGYPDIFEPIEEKTPEEMVTDWLFWTPRTSTSECIDAAKKLIAAGLDPDKLEASE